MILPMIMIVGMGGIELANLTTAYMRLNQIAIELADNASRAKQTSISSAPHMREYDVNEAFVAADKQYPAMHLLANGRIVLSSLETNASGGQWIHWQRCAGSKTAQSRYGVEGTGVTGTAFAGMGPAGNVIAADTNSAIMFVEVYYDYVPLMFSSARVPLYRSAAMYVRDDRDLSQIFNPAPTVTVNTC